MMIVHGENEGSDYSLNSYSRAPYRTLRRVVSDSGRDGRQKIVDLENDIPFIDDR